MVVLLSSFKSTVPVMEHVPVRCYLADEPKAARRQNALGLVNSTLSLVKNALWDVISFLRKRIHRIRQRLLSTRDHALGSLVRTSMPVRLHAHTDTDPPTLKQLAQFVLEALKASEESRYGQLCFDTDHQAVQRKWYLPTVRHCPFGS